MRSRLSDLTATLLRDRGDLIHLSPASDDPEDGLEFIGGPGYLDPECIYDPVEDATAHWLLDDWLDGDRTVGWCVHLQLSKLLAKRGQLVAGRVEPIVRELAAVDPMTGDSTIWYERELCLSYLPLLADGEALLLRCLERSRDDFRDGILHACHSLNTRTIYEALKANVRRWAEDESWGIGSGERWLMNWIVERWDQTFPGEDHADIRQLCRPRK